MRGEGAPGTRAESPLQHMERTVLEQPVEQPLENPTAEQVGMA